MPRLEIFDRVGALAERQWDRRLLGPGDFHLSTIWLGVLEQVTKLEPHYMVASGTEGEPLGGLVGYPIGIEAPAWDFYRLDRVFQRMANVTDRAERGIAAGPPPDPAVVMPNFLVGGRQACHSRLLLNRSLAAGDRAATADALLHQAEVAAAAAAARSVAFMFVDADDPLREMLLARGYHQFLHAKAGVMDIGFGSWEEYLERFTGHRRRRINRELRDFAEAGVTFAHHPLGAVIDEIAPLEVALEARYGIEETTAGVSANLAIMSAAMGGRGVALTAEQGGRIRGFVVAVHWDDTLTLRQAGFDYEFKGKLPLYYGLIFYHVVRYALSHGIRQVYYSIESAQAKASRGCRIVPQLAMIKGLDGPAEAELSRFISPDGVCPR